jgi:hypothetical protein
MRKRLVLACPLLLILALAACGGAATEMAPTRALAAPTMTLNIVATQTRTAELAQIATLTAPTATARPASPTANAAALGKSSLVGRTADPDAFVGIIVTGSEVVAYVCDGKNLAQWFTGTVQGESISLRAENGAQLTASVRQTAGTTTLQAASGTFRDAGGRSLDFSTTAPTDSLSKAGVYRGTGTSGNTSLTMGVIVLPDGQSRGVLRAGQQLLPVTNPTFATNSLTATFEGIGPVTAQRLGT